jgi:hypothetical protein
VKSQMEIYRAKAQECARLTISYKIVARGAVDIGNSRKCIEHSRLARNRRAFNVQNHRENEPDMTTYPLEFHRRSEQKWVLRARASTPRASIPRAALVGSSQRGHLVGPSDRGDILPEGHGGGQLGKPQG